MKYCNRLVVRAKNEAGDIAVVLYDENCKELERWPLDKTEGTWEFSFYPKETGKAEYIGFMANDGGLPEYADFKTTIYYVDFYMGCNFEYLWDYINYETDFLLSLTTTTPPIFPWQFKKSKWLAVPVISLPINSKPSTFPPIRTNLL